MEMRSPVVSHELLSQSHVCCSSGDAGRAFSWLARVPALCWNPRGVQAAGGTWSRVPCDGWVGCSPPKNRLGCTQNQAGASSGLDQAPLRLPTARVHCRDPFNVLGIRNSDSILYLRTMQAGFLERGLKAAWPALFSHTSSSTFLNHPIDLKGGFMK